MFFLYFFKELYVCMHAVFKYSLGSCWSITSKRVLIFQLVSLNYYLFYFISFFFFLIFSIHRQGKVSSSGKEI